ncbi:MAG: iron-containing alcohol dehydrogenase [Deltaproteobacteria bacterium]|nr:iron-containing alcohol dehydrogenase [Deltaproteobacteria bacterium]
MVLDGLRKFVAPELIFGVGALAMTARYVRNLGAHRAFVVSDPGVIGAGWTQKVADNLEEAGIPVTMFSDVSPNPRADQVMSGASIYRDSECDIIIAVGGGSPMDCAKAIGIVSTNERHVLSFEGVDCVDGPGPPLICIPTTAGTSADVSQFAIISDPSQRRKVAIISKTVVPDVALIDPMTTTTMDPHLTACTGVDGLAHAIEAFVSRASSPLTDLQALEAIRLIRTYLPKVLSNNDDIEARTQVMLGSLEAGLAFSNASLGAVHAMAHSLGGTLDLPHGECNSLLLDSVMAFNQQVSEERFARIAVGLGLDVRGLSTREQCQAAIDDVRALRKQAGITGTLRDRGVGAGEIPGLAEMALLDPCLVTNPRRAVRQDLETVFEEAL